MRAHLLSPPGPLLRAALLVLAIAAVACTKKPYAPEACTRPDYGGCIIEDVEIVDNAGLSDADIEEKIATAETSHVLGGAFDHVPIVSVWDRLTVDYERFDRFVLERDLARIERLYRAKGWYEAHARAARVTRRKDDRIRVEIAVDEGEPVRIKKVDLAWKDWLLPKASAVTQPVVDAKNTLRLGKKFDEESYEKTKKLLLAAMTERGFAYATVEGKVDVDLPTHAAHVLFTIELGPYCKFGNVKIEGLGGLPESPVRAAINIRPGDEFSTYKLEEAQYALAALGVFGSIEVRPLTAPKGQPQDPVVPVTFSVQPSPLHNVAAGVGVEAGSRVEAHVIGRWENRNFLGGLRRFAAEVKPGLVFHPMSLSKPTALTTVLPEVHSRLELTQPSFLWPRVNLIAAVSYNRYEDPSIYSVTDPALAEYLIGYNEISGSLFLQWNAVKQQFSITVGPLVTYDAPFFFSKTQFAPVDDTGSFSLANPATREVAGAKDLAPATVGYQQVFIPSLQTIVTFDGRTDDNDKPDKASPRSGVYVSTDAQVAALGVATDVRARPEFRAYVPVARKLTLAFRVVGGIIPFRSYGSSIDPAANLSRQDLEKPRPGLAVLSQSQTVTVDRPDGSSYVTAKPLPMPNQEKVDFCNDLQILQFRGFFSGGVNSNRGYGFHGVGPHTNVTCVFQPGAQVPTGGVGLWESSLELRWQPSALGLAFFLDGSDVTRALAPRTTHPHLSAGVGLRYQTPVGPVRADIGYRIPGLQVIGSKSGACDGADPPSTCESAITDEGLQDLLLGIPIAVNIAIGEAF